ncbi:hypothetical protein GBA63_18520 [Rubrobacter tropicus]|uniref:Uncharacterized protein n=1 Tax=Rubrobacter tropicus TaxID=2653851 RepID=A0A6G8QDD4_9ACTN|nr:ATP-binding protein [Rubrobacter tropicus]QIN84411.1 hypothetical protein GBA63_18520 [Rubrobacter tropicus]
MTSEEVERLTGRDFGPAGFASMCNAIAWASAKRRPSSLPSFTERVNVPDGGVDAEWETEVPEGDGTSALLGSGWNVFQYKQRDIATANRGTLLSKLKSDLKGAIKDLCENAKRCPDRYVLFVNLDLTHDEKRQLRENILEGYDKPEAVRVEIAGAAEIATFLTDMPHLRFAYLGTPGFSAVETEWNAHASRKPFGAGVDLVGRATEMESVTSFLEDQGARAMVLAGPQGMGKTRLALEAAKRNRPFETIVAVEPRSLELGDLLMLGSCDNEVVLILDDPDPDKAEELVHGALAIEGLKLLIVLPTPEDAPAPNFGQDDRVSTLKLEPLPVERAGELLRAAGPSLDFGLEQWVIERAGGNPDILLTAASVGPDLRARAGSFSEQVGKAFERRVKRKLGEEALKVLTLLSLLPQVGVARAALEELEAVLENFGDGATKHDILGTLDSLVAAGLVRPRGSYAEVTPTFFANHLCAMALRGRASELVGLFSALSDRARRRMIRRLQGLTVEEASLFWDAMLNSSGPLRDLPSAWSLPDLLRPAASAEPGRFVDMVWRGLSVMSRQERREIAGYERQQLVWALQECLYRRETAQTALRCLGLLAEAETDDHGSNATSVFCESFFWTNPQFPLTLDRRLLLLREMFEKEEFVGMRTLAVKAIEGSIPQRGMMLFVSQGPTPLDTAPPMTSDEISRYVEALVGLLMDVARSDDPEAADAAMAVLPKSIATSAFYARPRVAVERLETAVEWALTQEVAIPVADLAFQLRRVRDGLSRPGTEPGGETQKPVEDVDRLMERLDSGSFPVRLKRLAGEWTFEDYDREVDEHGHNLERGARKLRDLAQEILDNPEQLTDDLLDWLLSQEAEKSHVFFWQFGKLDTEKRWLAKVESLGSRDGGADPFGAYLAGLAEHDRASVEDQLDELSETREVSDLAILVATSRLGGSVPGIERIGVLLSEGRANPGLVERILHGRWTEPLESEDCLKLLRLLATPDLEHAMVAVRVANFWDLIEKPLEGELANFVWRCLEAARSSSDHDDYDLDRLSAALARRDPERGFRLLETLLRRADAAGWEPFGDRRENELWATLRGIDRERAIRLVISSAVGPQRRIIGVPQLLQGVLDQEADRDLLIALADQDERQAETIARSITAAVTGFWPVAVGLLARYPDNVDIQDGVALGAHRIRGGIISHWGPSFGQTESVLEDVERVLGDRETPEAAKPWLREFAAFLREKAEKERIEEIDEDIDL